MFADSIRQQIVAFGILKQFIKGIVCLEKADLPRTPFPMKTYHELLLSF